MDVIVILLYEIIDAKTVHMYIYLSACWCNYISLG